MLCEAGLSCAPYTHKAAYTHDAYTHTMRTRGKEDRQKRGKTGDQIAAVNQER
jgi:hypothetical protein